MDDNHHAKKEAAFLHLNAEQEIEEFLVLL